MLFLLIDLYSLILFASVILTWVNLAEDNPLVRFVRRVTEPVLEPVRKLVPSAGGFDLSPMIVLIALRLLKTLLIRL